MCGINGFNWQDRKLLREMNERIKHRGPNDEGYYLGKDISLGHRRLSIIDLSKRGHQPMFFDNKNLAIIYNGEIYNYIELRDQLKKKNYKFKSNTDTEVVLASYSQWGIKCLEKFNGMWAFCIYDKKKKILFLARDRFGIKPLYYYKDNSKFIFSSEIKPILSHVIKTSANEKLIYDFLLYNITDHTNETFFTGINKLPKGNFAIFDLKTKELIIKKWWKNQSNESKISIEEAIKTFRELLSNSVNMRLISDVPVGTCLSGGLDSSSIAALIKDSKKSEITTFSAVFPGFERDESKYINELSRFTEIRNKKIIPTAKGLHRDILDFIERQEEPVLGTSPYAAYCVYKLARENRTVVLLNGQGADEVLAGYDDFYGYYLKGLLKKFRVLTFINEFFALLRGNLRKVGVLSLFFLFLPKSIKEYYFYNRSNINEIFYNKIKTDYLNEHYSCSNLKEALIFHLDHRLEHLLRWEDKNSMAYSREARVPFLDYRLINFLLSLPESDIIRHGKTKWILRKAIHNLIPEQVLNRTNKVGFATPEDEWLRTKEFKELLKKLFVLKEPLCCKYINIKKLREIIKEHLTERKNNGRQIWKAVFLEIWLLKFFGGNKKIENEIRSKYNKKINEKIFFGIVLPL